MYRPSSLTLKAKVIARRKPGLDWPEQCQLNVLSQYSENKERSRDLDPHFFKPKRGQCWWYFFDRSSVYQRGFQIFQSKAQEQGTYTCMHVSYVLPASSTSRSGLKNGLY